MYETALAIQWVTFAVVMMLYVGRRKASVYDPFLYYAAFHFLVFVFRPLLGYILDYELIYRWFQFSPSPEERLIALIATNVGFVMFALGSQFISPPTINFKRDEFVELERKSLKYTGLATASICYILGIASALSNWGKINLSLGSMTMDKATGTIINSERVGYFVEAYHLAGSASLLFVWIFRFRLLSFTPLIIFVMVEAGSGIRGPFITAIVSVGLLYFYERKVKMPTARLMVFILMITVAFSAIGSDRGKSWRQFIDTDDQSLTTLTHANKEKFLEGMDTGNLEFMEYLVYVVPNRSGTYNYFADNLIIFTEWVPRAIWPGKPVGSPVRFVNIMDYGRPIGMTPGLPGEGWLGAGWIGVVGWCFLWGAVLARLYRRFARGFDSNLKLLAYLVFLPILIVAYRDGSPITVLRQGIFLAFPFLLWYLFNRLTGKLTIAEIRRTVALASMKGHGSAPKAERYLPPAVARRRAMLLDQAAKD